MQATGKHFLLHQEIHLLTLLYLPIYAFSKNNYQDKNYKHHTNAIATKVQRKSSRDYKTNKKNQQHHTDVTTTKVQPGVYKAASAASAASRILVVVNKN